MAYKDSEVQKAYIRQHHEKNRDKKRETNKLNVQRNKEFVKEYLESHPCVDCGEADPIVLEFDHVRGEKLFNICDGVRYRRSIENLQIEINKCEVRCANCHRRVTHQRRVNG